MGEITFAPDNPIDLHWSMEPKHVGSLGHKKSKLSKQSRAETFFLKSQAYVDFLVDPSPISLRDTVVILTRTGVTQKCTTIY